MKDRDTSLQYDSSSGIQCRVSIVSELNVAAGLLGSSKQPTRQTGCTARILIKEQGRRLSSSQGKTWIAEKYSIREACAE